MRVSKDSVERRRTSSNNEVCQRLQRNVNQIKKYIYSNSDGEVEWKGLRSMLFL